MTSKRILLIAASLIVLTGCGTTQPAATAEPAASPHKYTPLFYNTTVDGMIHYVFVDENGQHWENTFKLKPDGTAEPIGPMKPYNGPIIDNH